MVVRKQYDSVETVFGISDLSFPGLAVWCMVQCSLVMPGGDSVLQLPLSPDCKGTTFTCAILLNYIW